MGRSVDPASAMKAAMFSGGYNEYSVIVAIQCRNCIKRIKSLSLTFYNCNIPIVFKGYSLLNAKNLGRKIKERREMLRMTQETLAELTKRDQRSISEYEAGKRRLSAVDLPTFAKALQVSILYFFESEVTEQDFNAALLEQFNSLPTSQAKETAVELLRLYSKSLIAHYST
jgi:transcriptional regulator with XRE-family HTH domain